MANALSLASLDSGFLASYAIAYILPSTGTAWPRRDRRNATMRVVLTRKAKKGSKRKAQKTGLNRSMLDVGIGNLTKAIEYKLQEAGGFLVKVPTKTVKPSQTCPDCGHQHKKDLSERIHNCSECGATYDRDVAAAKVMLSWACGTGGHGSWRGNPYF